MGLGLPVQNGRRNMAWGESCLEGRLMDPSLNTFTSALEAKCCRRLNPDLLCLAYCLADPLGYLYISEKWIRFLGSTVDSDINQAQVMHMRRYISLHLLIFSRTWHMADDRSRVGRCAEEFDSLPRGTPRLQFGTSNSVLCGHSFASKQHSCWCIVVPQMARRYVVTPPSWDGYCFLIFKTALGLLSASILGEKIVEECREQRREQQSIEQQLHQILFLPWLHLSLDFSDFSGF